MLHLTQHDAAYILADFGPGDLTMVGCLFLFGLLAVFFLALAILTSFDNKSKGASRGLVIAAGVLFASGIVLGIVGKILGVKYGFP